MKKGMTYYFEGEPITKEQVESKIKDLQASFTNKPKTYENYYSKIKRLEEIKEEMSPHRFKIEYIAMGIIAITFVLFLFIAEYVLQNRFIWIP